MQIWAVQISAEQSCAVQIRADQAYQARSGQGRAGQICADLGCTDPAEIRSEQIGAVQIWTERGRQCKDVAVQIYADDGLGRVEI